MEINKLALIALAIFASACAKSFNNTSQNESKEYILGIDKNNGNVRLFKTVANDKDFLLYNSHHLIHYDEIKVIKKYSDLKQKDSVEIQELSRLYSGNQFKAAANKQSRNPNTDPLCIFEEANTWPCNMVFLAINISDMPLTLRQAIYYGIGMWQTANPNLNFIIKEIKDRDPVELGVTIIKVYKSIKEPFGASTVGFVPRGLVYFSPTASSVDVAHHIGHVLGYVDENVRPIRDNHIATNPDAIALIYRWLSPSVASMVNFYTGKMPVHNDKPPFDRYSIMMVPSYTMMPGVIRLLSNANEPLFTSLTGDGIINLNTALSAEDIRRINKVYPKIDDHDELRNTCK